MLWYAEVFVRGNRFAPWLTVAPGWVEAELWVIG